MINSIDVSIILVNYNTKQMTSECIDSIITHTEGVNYEIILVDNNSTDGSKDIFSTDNRVKYIYSEKNGGFGYGNNLGMHYAYGKYIFLLNTDTILINNAIKEFFDYAESHDNNTVYGCWLVDGNGMDACSYLNFPAFSFKDFWKIHVLKNNRTIIDHKEKNVDYICGADMFIPRAIIEAIGGFDTNIFLHSEEIEYQYRMKEKGIQRKIIPQPRIIHFAGKSTIKGSRSYLESHFILLKLHLPYWKYLLARVYYATVYTIELLPKINNKYSKELLYKAFQRIHLKKEAYKISLPINS